MRLLVVGGCERSGTSLMQKLLCLDPRIAGAGELVFGGRIAGLFADMAAERPEPWASRLRDHYSKARLAKAFRGLYLELLRPAREAAADILWVSEKTPSNVLAFEPLAGLFPEAAFLHVLRDGRDVLASHLEVERRATAETGKRPMGFSTRRVAARWNAAVDAHRRAIRDPSLGERYRAVRYEDLVKSPRATLDGLGDLLGFALDERALHPERIGAAEVGLPLDGVWTTDEADRRGFAPERVGRWRTELSPARKLLAHLTMGAGLAELGYQVRSPIAAASRLLHRLGRRRRSLPAAASSPGRR